ncbi:MAG: hypothetical protein HY996_02325 [Micrococcales bacterium]|nr:hypothetical protein [Micrococcales bacterium]
MPELRTVSTRSWWATSHRTARGTVIGAVVLVTGLVITSTIVWTSPNSPAVQAQKALSQLTGNEKLVSERNRLLSESVVLDTRLRAAWSASGAKDAQLRSLRAQLADLRSQLADTEARLAAASSSGARTAASPRSTTRPSPGVAPATLSTPSVAQITSPANPYFGLYTEQAPFNWSAFDAVAQKTGEKPGAVGFFAGWDEPYRANGVVRAWQRGMVPVMTWESRPIGASNAQKDDPDYTLAKIIGGQYDAYLRQFAADVRATGLPVVIRLDHEMNGDWYPWSERTNTNSAGQFVQMWRHVYDIFEQEGANANVAWLWSPNRIDRLDRSAQTEASLRALYPGDEYVDWVGMSGYLRSSSESPTFQTTFGRTLAQLRAIAPGKKIFLSEVGATETGGLKPAWITSFFEGINAPQNADIVGFGWFDLTVTSFAEGDTSTNDWRLESTRQSLAAFIAGYTAPGSRFAPRPF